jgi:hypothetical protein
MDSNPMLRRRSLTEPEFWALHGELTPKRRLWMLIAVFARAAVGS